VTSTSGIPMPPLELRTWVGPTDPEDFDNPQGTPIYAGFGAPLTAYETVFDFGCGCGRLARRLLQQTPRPRRYVGIDVHRGLIEWCRNNLSAIDPNFQFLHHDVYSPNYAPGNSVRLALPFPVNNATFSLVIASSVFTHLTRSQAEYYLSETARILTPEGIAVTSWFFFDRASFPFLPEVYCLYTSEADFGQAVLFDREWFLATVRNLGLGVRMTRPPLVAGHQWDVLLVKRTPAMVDQFPLGQDQAEWVSGASMKPMAQVTLPPEILPKLGKAPRLRVGSEKPEPPPLFGALAEVAWIRRSWTWRIGRALTTPVRMMRRWL
jgi:SAM-dependent methyltransferase